MFLHELTLKNIRSYRETTVVFSPGVTLLAGDIGSGKTTILLALEFALFGLLRGKTSPAELLRHGAKEGSVTLTFEVQGKTVSITRALKRKSSTIAQLPGIISIDGQDEELVATELKAKMLQLLGYPESLLSKSTNLFRYTVYTPQEQVKQILYESTEERKDVIRKIFQIDSYQKVVQNAALYVVDARSRSDRFLGQVDDLQQLEEQLVSQKKEITSLADQLPVVQKKVELAKKEVEVALKKKESYTKELQAYEMQLKELELEKQKRLHHEQLIALTVKRSTQLAREMQQFQELKKPEFSKDRLVKLLAKEKELREKQAKIVQRLGEIKGKFSLFNDRIQHLEVCPTCKQKVTVEHKHAVSRLQAEQKQKLTESQEQFSEVQVKIREQLRLLEEKIALLRKEQQQAVVFETQQKQVLLVQKQYQEAQDQLTKLKQVTFPELKRPQKPLLDESIAKEIDRTQLFLQEQQSLLTSLLTRKDLAATRLNELELVIKQKQALKTKATDLHVIKTWMQDLFVPLIKTIEKRVLLRVYHEFQSYFVHWFSQLVQDQELQVRLDEEFTPLVQQHGFDTTIENLSGGEKTAVALAYRLALNKVLNDYFSTLHTKGLLILDEPTDGFSSEQVDRLREVFDELGVKQLILVSHEPRLESVADKVIRVQKQHQESMLHYV